MDEWIEEVEKLAAVAGNQRQAAYAAYIRGTKNKWNCFFRTTPNCSHYFSPLRRQSIENCYLQSRVDLLAPALRESSYLYQPSLVEYNFRIQRSEFEESMGVTTPLVKFDYRPEHFLKMILLCPIPSLVQ